MKISTDRLSHLARLVLDGLWRDELIDYEDEGRALSSLKEGLSRHFESDDALDTLVRDKLTKQRKVPGSREWQILYDKYFREEQEKRRW